MRDYNDGQKTSVLSKLIAKEKKQQRNKDEEDKKSVLEDMQNRIKAMQN